MPVMWITGRLWRRMRQTQPALSKHKRPGAGPSEPPRTIKSALEFVKSGWTWKQRELSMKRRNGSELPMRQRPI